MIVTILTIFILYLFIWHFTARDFIAFIVKVGKFLRAQHYLLFVIDSISSINH